MLAGRVAPLLPLAGDDPHSRAIAAALRAGAPIDDDITLVVPTSGSTGIPKGALLSTAAVLAGAAATHARLGGPGSWLLALPAHHIAGLQVLVRALAAGTTPVRALPAAVAALAPGRRYLSVVSNGRRYLSVVSNQLAAAL
ncbi:AMP-binding protein, partial [Mycolicibacterium fallax]|uniref:AMP-binding protein n=1 Tax=Mycolicibacterium fallax TaxID=1793 RepID=UPI003908B1F6